MMNELSTKGRTQFTHVSDNVSPMELMAAIFATGNSGSVGNPSSGDAVWSRLPKVTCALTRASPQDVAIPVVVNDQKVELPAVPTTCKTEEGEGQAFFFDDSDNALFLAGFAPSTVKHPNKGQLIRISFPENKPSKAIEQALAQSGRVRIYGIYFDFASATIRPESEPALKEIAAVMAQNSGWELSVEGHTDNIGGDAFNMDLSRRRAEAVKQALVGQYHVTVERLTTTGFGATRPVESNDTIEGRARNRRVELVRQ